MRIRSIENLTATIVLWLASCSWIRADVITYGPIAYLIPDGPFSLLSPSDGGFTGTQPRP